MSPEVAFWNARSMGMPGACTGPERRRESGRDRPSPTFTPFPAPLTCHAPALLWQTRGFPNLDKILNKTNHGLPWGFIVAAFPDNRPRIKSKHKTLVFMHKPVKVVSDHYKPFCHGQECPLGRLGATRLGAVLQGAEGHRHRGPYLPCGIQRHPTSGPGTSVFMPAAPGSSCDVL